MPPDDLIPSLLAASDVLGTGWFAAVAAAAGPGKTVAVVGDGAVGLLAVLAATAAGRGAHHRHEPARGPAATGPRVRRDRHRHRARRRRRRADQGAHRRARRALGHRGGRHPGVDDAGDPVHPSRGARRLRRRPHDVELPGHDLFFSAGPPARRPGTGPPVPARADRSDLDRRHRPRPGLRPRTASRPRRPRATGRWTSAARSRCCCAHDHPRHRRGGQGPRPGRRPPLRPRGLRRRPHRPRPGPGRRPRRRLRADGHTAAGFVADVRDGDSLARRSSGPPASSAPIEVLQYSPLPAKEYMRPVLETTADDLVGPVEFSVYGSVTAVRQVLPGMRRIGARHAPVRQRRQRGPTARRASPARPSPSRPRAPTRSCCTTRWRRGHPRRPADHPVRHRRRRARARVRGVRRPAVVRPRRPRPVPNVRSAAGRLTPHGDVTPKAG